MCNLLAAAEPILDQAHELKTQTKLSTFATPVQTKKTNLLFITTGLALGGAEIMLLKIVQRLNRHIFNPSVISLSDYGVLALRLEEMGVPVTAIGMKARGANVMQFAKLYNAVRQFRPDIVQTWMYHADLIGGLATRLAGVKQVVWSMQNSDLLRDTTKFSTRVVIRMCAPLSWWIPMKIHSCSVKAATDHKAIGYCYSKIATIPTGFDLSRFRPDPNASQLLLQELGISSSSRLVGMIARADPQTDHENFLNGVALVSPRFPDAYFILAGNGVDATNAQLKQMVNALSLKDRVRLMGPRHDMELVMAGLHTMVLPSAYGEAFPNVVGEAMSCGVPCIVTDVGDAASIVDDTGIVVQPRHSGELAAAIAKMLRLSHDQRLDLGKRARLRITRKYNIDDIVREHEKLYLQCLGKT